MKYKTILFDIDDTILDFHASEARGLKYVFNHFGYELTDEYLNNYKQINRGLWSSYEKNEIELSYVLQNRFKLAMANVGIEVDGIEWEKEYRAQLNMGYEMMDNAHEVLEKLSKTYDLYIASNGLTETQRNRMERTDLIKYFKKEYYIDTTGGKKKPNKEFFDFIENDIEGYDKSTTILVGDTIATDILGGINAGIDTCHITRTPCEYTDVVPTYTINSLVELFDIL